MCSQHDVLHTVNRDKGGGARRLLSSSADTYVGPACGYKAVLAEALVWAGGVHAAGVFAGRDTSSWLCTLVDVWRNGKKNPRAIFKDLLKSKQKSQMWNGESGHGPMQRVREWSSLKPALHSHMVPKYERTQRPFAQLHSSESSSELSPAAEKGVRNRVVSGAEPPKEFYNHLL